MAEHSINNAEDALRKAYALVSHVKKTGTNQFSNYTFASETDILEVVRPALKKVGLTCKPVKIKYPWREKDGKNWHFGATYTFRFYHAESATHFDTIAQGWGTDTLDKAANKAATVAQKYALRQALLMVTGDDEQDLKPFTTKREMKEHYPEYAEYLQEEINACRDINELFALHAEEQAQLKRYKAKCELTYEGLLQKFTDKKQILNKNKLTGAME